MGVLTGKMDWWLAKRVPFSMANLIVCIVSEQQQ